MNIFAYVTEKDAMSVILFLVPLFAAEMGAADDVCDAGIITLQTRIRLAAISILKIPVVSLLCICVPALGLILFGITTILSLLMIFLGYKAWKKAKRPS